MFFRMNRRFGVIVEVAASVEGTGEHPKLKSHFLSHPKLNGERGYRTWPEPSYFGLEEYEEHDVCKLFSLGLCRLGSRKGD